MKFGELQNEVNKLNLDNISSTELGIINLKKMVIEVIEKRAKNNGNKEFYDKILDKIKNGQILIDGYINNAKFLGNWAENKQGDEYKLDNFLLKEAEEIADKLTK